MRHFAGLVVACSIACNPARESKPPPATATTPKTPTTSEAPPVESAPPVASSSALSSETPPPEQPLERVPCAKKGLFFVPPKLAVSLDCYPDCPGEGVPVVFRVVNCTDRKLKLDAYGRTMEQTVSPILEGDYNRVLEPGTRSPELRIRAHGPDAGKLKFDFVAVDSPDEKPERAELPIALADRKLDRARNDCKNRGDYWGAMGISGIETCWKLMRDAGKTCHDKRDCQGECILVSEKDVSDTEKLVTGRCSKLETEFGCATRIGATNKGRMPKTEGIPSSCAD